MPYQVLALKWRPQVFEEVVGQPIVTRTLQNAIQQDRIAHAFLFSGVRGVGKTTMARILAKALNCAKGPTVKPCGECASCREIASSTSLDVLEMDAASHTKVEEMREVLEASRYAPSRDRFKIYVIDEVHMLSGHSFNALLKTLEEPPPHLKFIFATTEYHKIPDTIASRCQQFEFRTVPATELAVHLRKIADDERLEITESALMLIARSAEGSIRDALSALDQVVAATGSKIEEKDVSELLGLIDSDVLGAAARAIVERDHPAILRTVDQLVRTGRDLQSFSRGLMQYLRDVLVTRVAPESPELVSFSANPAELADLAGRLSEEDLIRSLDVLTGLEGSLRWSPEPRFHLEVAMLKLSEIRRLASFEELLARFEALEAGTGGSAGGDSTGGTESRRLPRPSGASTARRGSRDEPSAAPAETPEAKAQATEETPTLQGPEVILETVLTRLREAKPKVAALLSHRNRVLLEGDCLRVEFGSEQRFILEQVEQENSKRLVDKEASDVAGRSLRVEFGLVRTETPRDEPSDVQAARDQETLFERVSRDPMVRSFVETFRGEVDSVRPFDEDPLGDRGGDPLAKRQP